MKTNLKLFMKNYKTMCKYGNDYINSNWYKYFKENTKICKCVIPFYHDNLLIEKDNIYLLREKEVGYVLYELTGIWIPKGHQGQMLTTKAVTSGIRGWNIPSCYKDYFKITRDIYLYPFLYSEEE